MLACVFVFLIKGSYYLRIIAIAQWTYFSSGFKIMEMTCICLHDFTVAYLTLSSEVCQQLSE